MAAGQGEAGARGPLVRYGDFVFRYRNGLFPVVLGVLLLGFRPEAGWGSAADRWLDALGLLLALAGEGLRVLVVGLAYIKRGGVNKRVYADSLVTGGIFAHCRNPLYVGNVLVLLGLFAIHGNPWVWALGTGFVLISYAAVVAAEERYLRARFPGEYAEYCRRVNRWLPDPRGLGATLRGMRFNWRRVLVKEYSSATSFVVAICVLLGWEILATHPGEDVAARLWGLAAVAVLAGAGAVAVRRLKKRGRLQESSA